MMQGKKAGIGWSDGLPDIAYDFIFHLLKGKDLMTCRKVCKLWDGYCTSLLFDKTRIIFDPFKPSKPVYRGIGGALRKLFCLCPSDDGLASAIQQDPLWISNWSDLMFRNARETNFDTILTVPNDQSQATAFENMTHLGLSNCNLCWITFLSLIYKLPKLQSLSDSVTDSKLGIQSNVCIDCSHSPQQLQLTLALLEIEMGLNFKFKKIKIERPENDLACLLYLKQIGQASKGLEELELNLKTPKTTNFPDQFIQFDEVFKVLLLKQTRTLKRISFRWIDEAGFHLIHVFYRALWFMSLTSGFNVPMQLTHIDFHFNLILIDQKFIVTLVPFIKRQEYLKVLSIRDIVIQESVALLVLSSVQPVNAQKLNTKISFGILFTDKVKQFNISTISVFKTDQSLQQKITSVDVGILSLSDTENLSEILPLGDTIVFPNANDLCICAGKTHLSNTWCRFKDFNFDEIWKCFPNLTSLSITDGDKDLLNLKTWNEKSFHTLARMRDEDMQLLFRTLLATKLTRLILTLRMDEMTDFGMTGMISGLDGKLVRKGCSLSSLKDLEVCLMKGLGTKITDATAFYAFNNLPKLIVLGICGKTSITSTGRSFLSKKFYKSKKDVVYTCK